MADIPDHKWLHQLQEHWEIITTVLVMFVTGIKLYATRAAEKERRLANVEHISETLADQLYEIKMDAKQAVKDNLDQHNRIDSKIDHVMDTILGFHKHE